MNKSMSRVAFVVALCTQPLFAMELELIDFSKQLVLSDEESFTENIFDTIQEQQIALLQSTEDNSAQTYYNDLYSLLTLDRLPEKFNRLSEKCKREVLQTISTPLLYLHVLAVNLPPDIIKNHIIFCMLDHEEEAVEKFYALPLMRALDIYHTIKSELINDAVRVGPLYAQSSQVRDLILKLQKEPWYYSSSIVNFESKEKIDLLPEELKNTYLHGKKILVLPTNDFATCIPKKIGETALLWCSMGACLFGSVSAIWTVGGLIVGSGYGMACNPLVLSMNSGVSFGFSGVWSCIFCAQKGWQDLCDHSEHMTL